MNRILIIIVLLSLCVSASAQKKSKKTVVLTPEEELYNELLPSTAKVMFLDSVVCGKNEFLRYIPLPPECGTMTYTQSGVDYINEFGDTRLSSIRDSINSVLTLSHRYASGWEGEYTLSELDSLHADYPYLMADGITLYFSGSGEGTVGGRDIFKTVYNSASLSFYEPTNMGLPYNSPANEYLLAISDVDGIGWLVSDRHQDEDHVCVYTFVVPKERVMFSEETSTDDIKSYAMIDRIKDTWGFGDYSAGVRSLQELQARINSTDADDGIFFVVSDDVVYRSVDSFSSKATREMFLSLQQRWDNLRSLQALLDTSRESLATASAGERNALSRKIATLEDEVAALQTEVSAAEKRLRATEQDLLTHK